MRTSLIFVAGLAIVAGLVILGITPAQELRPVKSEPGGLDEPPDVQSHVKAVLGARDSLEAETAYEQLFALQSKSDLRCLLRDANDGVALQGAWQELVPPGEGFQLTSYGPRQWQKLAWFLGFLEGRTRVQAPRWWADLLLGSRLRSGAKFDPPEWWTEWIQSSLIGELPVGSEISDHLEDGPDNAPKGGLYHQAGLGRIRAPRGTSLTGSELSPILRIGNDSVKVPGIMLFDKETKRRVWENISAVFTASRCYVALHDSLAGPYRLIAIERRSSKLLWSSDVWGPVRRGGRTGGGFTTWVEVTEQNNRVVVFGFSNEDVHVEGFRSADGANLFRFCSSYACGVPEATPGSADKESGKR